MTTSDEKSLVDDLADVLARMTVGWEYEFGFDLAQHPDVVRVMARYRAEKAAEQAKSTGGRPPEN